MIFGFKDCAFTIDGKVLQTLEVELARAYRIAIITQGVIK